MKILKYLFLGIFFSVLIDSVYSQAKKPTIFIEKFTSDSSVNGIASILERCQSVITQNIFKSGKFILLERISYSEVEAERERQKSASFIDGEVVKQGKAKKSDYAFSGNLLLKNATLNIGFKDYKNGFVANPAVINLSPLLRPNATKMDWAIVENKLIKSSDYLISQLASSVKFKLVKSLNSTSDKVKEVLLAGGAKDGLYKGMEMEVFINTMEEVDNIEISRSILVGELEITNIENENFSDCEVTKGKKEIFQYFSSKTKLYARVKNK